MTTIAELSKILKPSTHLSFFTLCANFLAEIKEAASDGEDDYEIRGLHTKSGNPYVIRF